MKTNQETKRETKKEIKQQSRLLLILALVLLVAVTAGVSYAFFNYTRFGTTDNMITTGTITFFYDEINQEGNGITLTDAVPITDSDGMKLTGSNNVFNFRIVATTTSNVNLPYEITARKDDTSDDIDDSIKVYLSEVDSETETAAPLTINGDVVKKYSELIQTTTPVSDGVVEKTIYTGTIPANSNNYEKNFRLRMWIDEETDFSPTQDEYGNDIYEMNNKKFKINVNVYSNATVVTAGE